jgi:hypothetical protein
MKSTNDTLYETISDTINNTLKEPVNDITNENSDSNIVKFSKRKYVMSISSDFITKLIVYGMIGILFEVSNYITFRIGRKIPLLDVMFKVDWRIDDRLNLNGMWNVPIRVLYGQVSLWMFLVYGLGAILIVEPMYKILNLKCKWYIRGIVYSIGLIIFEMISGLILNSILGYKIWYYADALNISQTTSLYLFFMWYIIGLFVESLYKKINWYNE